ncbi:flavin reductase [Granulicella tundricola]|uniref:Flavin reductase domain protein FMN-binding protein n=1 Tax=Granulicella tundricola (strain ATCC BAA-1859 / DSM 23138 / MP5ACTX9) TaxID=1198114 RepID=E8WZ61_GRATM|nr:flavin reductase [Granulicella tundricola]ADW67663.1 flavin reductase domain protein FMN-binding protein [Granulicella tundricola MP5ACTX9]
MPIDKKLRRLLRDLLFGGPILPQEFTIGLKDPAAEIAVWLEGMGAPLDVSSRLSTACSSPFLICLSFEESLLPDSAQRSHLSLHFREREGDQSLLGRIDLRFISRFKVSDLHLLLFEARAAANYCLSARIIWPQYLFQTYARWRKPNTSGMSMTFLEQRAAMVTFIRPHPIMLVSAADRSGGNLFPMNIMGELGSGRIAFALKTSRTAAPLIQRTGRAVLSNVPFTQASTVYRLAPQHFAVSIDWTQLPFGTNPSRILGVPVPVFALRVREVQIEHVQPLGSHTLFIARILSDETPAEGETLCAVHGFYQARRLKTSAPALHESLLDDRRNKLV